MARKWINASKAQAHKGTITYFQCPGKCGWGQVPPLTTPHNIKCNCGYEYTVLQVQGARILIEENK